MTGQVPPTLGAVIAGVQGKTSYSHSSWGIRVADLQSGEVLIEQASDTAFVPGSIMKVYSTAAALDAYGPDFRFHTPVYRLGSVSEGTLRGNLVLVASGDFNFGLRDQPDGTLGFNNLPQLDHNYADTGFPGAHWSRTATRSEVSIHSRSKYGRRGSGSYGATSQLTTGSSRPTQAGLTA